MIARSGEIQTDDLPQAVRRRAADGVTARRARIEDRDGDLKTRIRRYEAALIQSALDECDGNQTEAARLLDVPLRTLVHKLKTLGIKR